MADYKVTLTSAGAALMAKCLAGQTLTFTAVQLGDGDAPVPFVDMGALAAVKKTLPISQITRRDTTAIIKAVLDFTSVTEDFQWREVGLIARDPDTGVDVLYCYGNAGDKGDWITGGVAATAKRINITALVSSVAQVTAVIDNTRIYASIEDLERKADLVNGKVPDAQLPEMNYDPVGAAQVVQGNLQTHMADKDNPHGVTAEQVGAIPVNGNIDCGAWT